MPLRYVQIETTTLCNQRCHFCPVATEGRAFEAMPMDAFDRIVEGLRGHDVEVVYLNGFNEPTYDKNLVERVQRLRAAGNYKIILNTNASGLKPELADRLIAAGVKHYIVNLSTLDEAEYERTRGSRDLKKVLANLDYLLETGRSRGAVVEIVVLGNLAEAHWAAIEQIEEQFARFTPRILVCPIAEFAGDPRRRGEIRHKTLRGCALGDRPQQWLHFTANGQAISCCHDYQSEYVLGDIRREPVRSIWEGQALNQFRRWATGQDEAPEDFLCRRCVMAVSDHDFIRSARARFCESCVLPAKLGVERSCGRCVVQQVIETQARPVAGGGRPEGSGSSGDPGRPDRRVPERSLSDREAVSEP